MRRLVFALLLALAWLALPAARPAQAALTTSQFAAIDGIYAAFAAFEDADGATAADRVAARRTCNALDSTDPLLAALRRACGAQLAIGQALGATARCAGRRTACLVGVVRVRRAASAYLRLARAANRAVVAAGVSAACRRELTRGAAELAYVTGLRNGFAQLERALRRRSLRAARRARRRIAALRQPEARPVAQQREDYRASCAPPG